MNEVEQELAAYQSLHKSAAGWKKKLRTPEEVGDIVHEVVLKLMEKGKWPPDPAYGNVAVKHYILDSKRKALGPEPEEEEEFVVEEAASELEQKEWLEGKIGGLEWEEQKIMRLRLRGHTYQDIANQVKKPVSTVQALVAKHTDQFTKEWAIISSED